MVIYYSDKFLREYKKLPQSVKSKAQLKEPIFRQNPFDPRLKTHKLTGKLSYLYSFSVDYHYRILFSFENETEVWFVTIGTHSIYK